MRYMIECWIPSEDGNCSVLDGTLPIKLKKYIDSVKPEAVYVTIKDGQGAMVAFVNIQSEDKMVATMEPLWLDWDASITCTPAMSKWQTCRRQEKKWRKLQRTGRLIVRRPGSLFLKKNLPD